jgi:alcohol dehydrogenase, propanol-preferring
MRAMLLTRLCQLRDNPAPLQLAAVPEPVPGPGQVLLRVAACGVCRTELDEIEGRTPPPRLPVIPGHQVVGRVAGSGSGSTRFRTGDRVGVSWIHSACGVCDLCRAGRENLCPEFRATGRDVHGGYGQYMVVPEGFACPIPGCFSDSQAAPMLCAGAVGHRSLRLTGLRDGQALGLTGFGASAHLVLQVVRHCFPNTSVVVFARDPAERALALELGAAWAGDTAADPPVRPDCIIDTTPAWQPLVEALRTLRPGGTLVVNAIRKEETDKDCLRSLDYATHLWLEKQIRSVANVTRADVSEFLSLAAEMDLRPRVQEYALEEANRALAELKFRKIRGAKVLCVP